VDAELVASGDIGEGGDVGEVGGDDGFVVVFDGHGAGEALEGIGIVHVDAFDIEEDQLGVGGLAGFVAGHRGDAGFGEVDESIDGAVGLPLGEAAGEAVSGDGGVDGEDRQGGGDAERDDAFEGDFAMARGHECSLY